MLSPTSSNKLNGFTLVELSIVLVIIGLIVGGVLVGADLIKSSGIRAQLKQIEQFNTAARTFQIKYGYLPGDILSSQASQIGLNVYSGAQAGTQGKRDGNGIIEGYYNGGPSLYAGEVSAMGETCLFWVDLTGANGANINLIEGNYKGSTAGIGQDNGICSLNFSSATGEQINDYFPKAKIGNGNYVYVWSGGGQGSPNATNNNGINYFGIARINTINGFAFLSSSSNAGISPQDAYILDSKIDDGLPMAGIVTALYTTSWALWSDNDSNPAITTSTANCFNQAWGVAGDSFYYKQNTNPTCGLSFQFQ